VALTSASLGEVFRCERAGIVGALLRACGRLDLAEDAVQDAFIVAAEVWSRDGVPPNPAGWITTTAKNRMIDRLRRERRRVEKEALLERIEGISDRTDNDAVLQLIFTCCHPALSLETRVALTLRTVCGLTTEQVASAFVVPPSTMSQRLVRAQRKIQVAGIPYAEADPDELQARLSGVLAVLYLVFNRGYDAVAGTDSAFDEPDRVDLCEEAIGLARRLSVLMPNEPEIMGLLALLLLMDSRRAARRSTADGALILFEDQDRTLWDRGKVEDGLRLLERAPRIGGVGQYWLQAAIAAEHVAPARAEDRDWSRICRLYDRLAAQVPGSDVVLLNRAIAVGHAEGPRAALAALAPLRERLGGYVYFHAADAAYLAAIALAGSAAQRESLERARKKLPPDVDSR
jgi:RNA polymerase sigma-70 factor (ECF subfamily)